MDGEKHNLGLDTITIYGKCVGNGVPDGGGDGDDVCVDVGKVKYV